jgi:hypothetical protein
MSHQSCLNTKLARIVPGKRGEARIYRAIGREAWAAITQDVIGRLEERSPAGRKLSLRTAQVALFDNAAPSSRDRLRDQGIILLLRRLGYAQFHPGPNVFLSCSANSFYVVTCVNV